MKILINFYHPVCIDLATTFKKLGHTVDVCFNTDIKDHYGDWNILLEKYKKNSDINCISLKIASLLLVKSKYYDLVGLDGVFNGDQLLMSICKEINLPYFCIDGYPNVYDEPSENILSFGWGLPLIQYNQKYQSEYHKKEIDWKNIFEKGCSESKNIYVFYPNFWEIKTKTRVINSVGPIISGVQNYKKYNKWSCEVFDKIKEKSLIDIKNFEEVSHEVFIKELQLSRAFLLLKWADRPGIALLEAMLLGKPILTMRSYILASFNPEILIDNFNCIIADTVEELIEKINVMDKNTYKLLGEHARNHALELTSFDRQKDKLQTFLERCVK